MDSEEADAAVSYPYSSTLQCLGICKMTSNSNACSKMIEYKLPPQVSKSDFPIAKPLPLLNESLPIVEKSERFLHSLSMNLLPN